MFRIIWCFLWRKDEDEIITFTVFLYFGILKNPIYLYHRNGNYYVLRTKIFKGIHKSVSAIKFYGKTNKEIKDNRITVPWMRNIQYAMKSEGWNLIQFCPWGCGLESMNWDTLEEKNMFQEIIKSCTGKEDRESDRLLNTKSMLKGSEVIWSIGRTRSISLYL